MGVGGGHGMGHTIVGFVGGYDAGKGYMMSGKCWLQSIYSSPVVLLRAFITPSHSWMRRRTSGKSRWWNSILQKELQYNGLHSLRMVWCRIIWSV